MLASVRVAQEECAGWLQPESSDLSLLAVDEAREHWSQLDLSGMRGVAQAPLAEDLEAAVCVSFAGQNMLVDVMAGFGTVGADTIITPHHIVELQQMQVRVLLDYKM